VIRDKKAIVAIIIFLISGLTNYYIQQKNIQILKTSFPEKIRFSQSIKTQDDWSYISPIQNYIQKNQWKEASYGKNSYFKRSPGYPWFIGLFILKDKKLTQQNLKTLIGIQIILQALIPVLLFLLFLQFKIQFSISIFASILWGILPSFNGFTNYTLTESIAPFFVTFFIYLILGKQKWKIYLSVIILAYLIILKPVFLPFILCYFFIIKPFNFKTIGFYIIISVLPLTIWKIRCYSIDKQSIDLHPIYHPQNKNVFRLPHQKIFDLVKLYNPNGKEYHEWINKLETKAKQNQPINWQEALSIFPKNVITLINKKKLKQSILYYYQSLSEIKTYASKGIYSSKEIRVANDFKIYQKKISRSFPITSYIVTPIIVLKNMIIHSNLNLYIFQHHFRNQIWMESLRLFALLLHCIIFIIAFLNLFLCKKHRVFIAFLIPLSIILIYFVFIQRALEERYTYPFLGILYFSSFISIMKSRKNKKIQ
jgi:hypothetical protein